VGSAKRATQMPAYDGTRAEYAKRIETWEQWNEVSIDAQGNLAYTGSLPVITTFA
jgi:hypothetical protein